MIKLSFNIEDTFEIYETDWNGAIKKDSNNHIACGNCTIKLLNDKYISFGFHNTIPKSILENVTEGLTDYFCYISKNVISSFFQNCNQFNIFKIMKISSRSYLDDNFDITEITDLSKSREPFECTVNQPMYSELELQQQHYVKAQKAFNNAVKNLQEFATYDPFSLKYNQSELNSALSFISRSLRVADLGHMYSWYHEKQSVINSVFSDMLKRKNGNHPGYKTAQDSIAKILFRFRAPSVWKESPPL